MFLDHDSVDRPGVLECKETETARSARGAISHDSAFVNLAKLREVVVQILLHVIISMLKLTQGCRHSFKSFFRVRARLRSVVSQLRPPMNIFLHHDYVSYYIRESNVQ